MENTISTKVEGMTCGNCALTISKLLEKKGVTNISANAASGDVSFTIVDSDNVDKIFDAIDDLGYKVVRDEEKHDHAHHDHHNHDHSSVTDKLWYVAILFTIPLLLHMFVPWGFLQNPWTQLVLSLPVFAIGTYVFLPSAYRSLKHGLPNMNVLVMLGASAAFFYSIIGLFFFSDQAHNFLFFETAASIITLVMTGNWLEHRTVKSTTVAIDALVKLQPQYAKLVMTDSIGKETILEVESKYVKHDDILIVNNGDSVPVDGMVVFGDAHIDEHMITGESMPVHKRLNDIVVGGTLITEGNIKIKATTVGNASVLASIIKMVREAQAIKPRLQKLADKISAIFVPSVLVIAAVTFLVNYFFVGIDFTSSMMRSIAVLVISCPCAMGLATPAAVAVGLGRAAKNGILIKGGDTLSSLKTIKQIVFDKTGTLTTGKLQIESFSLNGIEENVFKSIVAALEQNSSHPIAKSVLAQWNNTLGFSFSKIKELKGMGLEAEDEDGNIWRLGSEKWLHENANSDKGFDFYLYQNDLYKGALKIADELRADAIETIKELKKMGYKTILLSGDKKSKCKEIAQTLGIDEVYAEQTPEQKNQVLDKLMHIAPTAMVGDGINDAPALAKATVGISLSESTQIAIQSANVILSNNHLSTLPRAIRLGIYTEQTIRQNLFWAFIYNIIAIPVAAVGLLTPIWGAGIMALSDVVLILNSLRLGVRKIR